MIFLVLRTLLQRSSFITTITTTNKTTNMIKFEVEYNPYGKWANIVIWGDGYISNIEVKFSDIDEMSKYIHGEKHNLKFKSVGETVIVNGSKSHWHNGKQYRGIPVRCEYKKLEFDRKFYEVYIKLMLTQMTFKRHN